MSSKDLAVSVRGLSKSYTIAHNAAQHTTAGEAIAHRLRNPIQRVEKETFWALQDVSFDVMKGDVLGIIGRNGAGKSTLLKVLSQITEPTAGEIRLYGRVGSLLEVGTGFHPELTGRENIFLNGAILGMKKSEITQQFDAIVQFAEVEKFLDTPVKRYSSGMYVRLAFAVAAHLNPEILIVDEVLAVGDASFQKKCLGKMHNVSQQEGKTVLFVSHNMSAVQALCTKCLVMKQGSISYSGETERAIEIYNESGRSFDGNSTGIFDLSQRKNKHLPETLIINKSYLLDAKDQVTENLIMGQPFKVVVESEGLSEFRESQVGISFKTFDGYNLATFATSMRGPKIQYPRNKSEKIIFSLPEMPFVPGSYSIDIAVAQQDTRMLDEIENAMQFKVIEWDIYGNGFQVQSSHGAIFLDGKSEIVNQ